VSTRSGSSRARNFVMSRPAAENCRSDWADVAGMDKNCFATAAVAGYRWALAAHHCRASVPPSSALASKYASKFARSADSAPAGDTPLERNCLNHPAVGEQKFHICSWRLSTDEKIRQTDSVSVVHSCGLPAVRS